AARAGRTWDVDRATEFPTVRASGRLPVAGTRRIVSRSRAPSVPGRDGLRTTSSMNLRRSSLVLSFAAAFAGCGVSSPSANVGGCLQTFTGHSEYVCSVALHPDGKL